MYRFYNPNPCGKAVGDCVIRAVSKVENISWEQAYISMCVFGYVHCDMPSSNAVWAANTTISMRDESFTHMWIKSTNASGTVVAFRTFNVSEVVEEKPKYITMADFEAFKKELFDSLGGK